MEIEILEFDWFEYAVYTITSATIALAIAMYFRYKVKPRIEQIYEKNYFSALVGLFGYVDSFDSYFEMFYQNYEEKFRNILDLPKDEFLPSICYSEVNETGGFTLIPKPEPEYSEIQNHLSEFKKYNENIFARLESSMNDEATRIYSYMEKNEQYIVPGIRLYVRQYIHWSMFYVTMFRTGWNYPDELKRRLVFAQKIMEILKNEKVFDNTSYNDKFTKKWQDYMNSEKI